MTTEPELENLLNTATALNNRNFNTNTYEKISSTPQTNEDLVGLIDNILNNIKNLSDKREFFEAYYDAISDTVGLKDCVNFINDKKGKGIY
jgi:hypothetical protein